VPNFSADGQLSYNASSPDELALTNAARFFGLVFEDRDADNKIVISDKITGRTHKYELLNVIEFTSLRKRMSVIVRTPDDRILCLTKGADSIILARLRDGQDELIKRTDEFLDDCAKQGLRTLLLAQREIDPNFYE
jgi:magnesium-transporting ATPase (P-type)